MPSGTKHDGELIQWQFDRKGNLCGIFQAYTHGDPRHGTYVVINDVYSVFRLDSYWSVDTSPHPKSSTALRLCFSQLIGEGFTAERIEYIRKFGMLPKKV